MDVTYQELQGSAIEPWIEQLAHLRIRVFHEFPYCYQGDMDNETEYLQTYLKSESIHLILAFLGDILIGASTSLPLQEEVKEIKQPFLDQGLPLDKVYYFGESVILPEYRGRGTGHEFFKRREAQAHRAIENLQHTTFCGVDRPPNHPLRPEGYRNLHAFWKRMGYSERPDLKARLKWKDRGDEFKTEKSLTFWLKKW